MKHPYPMQLQLSNPCDQKWHQMSLKSDGRFCAHCRKTVVDYTGMSDAALLAHIRGHGIGCGRFRHDQLDRSIEDRKESKRTFLPAMMLSLGVLLGNSKAGNCQSFFTAYSPAEMPTELPEPNKPVTRKEVRENFFRIYGTVLDSQNDPIPSVQIRIQGTDEGTLSDTDGHYELNLPISYKSRPFLLTFTSIWNDSVQVDVMLTEAKEVSINVVLQQQLIRLGGAITTCSVVHLSRWQSLKYRLKRKLHFR